MLPSMALLARFPCVVHDAADVPGGNAEGMATRMPQSVQCVKARSGAAAALPEYVDIDL